MEKRSTPNKTAKHVLVFILIAAATAVLIFSLVNNNKPAQSKAYGESYAAALIADIQGSSAVEYTVKRDSFDHSSVWVLGTESRLNSAIFSPKATLIPAENDADEAVQSIILSMALKLLPRAANSGARSRSIQTAKAPREPRSTLPPACFA